MDSRFDSRNVPLNLQHIHEFTTEKTCFYGWKYYIIKHPNYAIMDKNRQISTAIHFKTEETNCNKCLCRLCKDIILNLDFIQCTYRCWIFQNYYYSFAYYFCFRMLFL